MHVIHKLTLEIKSGPQRFQIPSGSEIVAAQMQGGLPRIWFKRPVEKTPDCNATFAVVGTGHAFDGSTHHIVATVQDDGFVWHIMAITADECHATEQSMPV